MLFKLHGDFLLRNRIQISRTLFISLIPDQQTRHTDQINKRANKHKPYQKQAVGMGDGAGGSLFKKYTPSLAAEVMSKFIYTTYIHLGLPWHRKDINAA